MIGIIVAMDKELHLLEHIFEQTPSAVSVNNFNFITGTIAGKRVVAGRCGIGKVNAAIGTLTMIENFHPSVIVNTGVAGGTGAGTPPAHVLDVVLASEIAHHDVWCGPGTTPGQAAGCPPRFTSPLDADTAASLGARCGLIASGDIFVDKPDDLRRILSLYPDALAVDMESAAIAQVCHLKGVPFICLRVVSDTPGDKGNAAAYTDFWSDAPRRTFNAVEKLLALL